MDEEKPVLKIKKDSEPELTYHYNREERISLRGPLKSDTRKKSKFGIFRQPFMMLLLTLSAIFLIFNLLSRFVYNNENEFILAGYAVRIEAIVWEKSVLAKAMFTNTGKETAPPATVWVEFTLKKSGSSVVCEEPLPEGVKDTREVTRLLESDKKDESLVTVVKIGNEEKKLITVPEKK